MTPLFQWLFNHSLDNFGGGKLVFSSPLAGELRFLLFAAAIVGVWFLYRKAAARTSRKTWRVILGLRLAAIGLLFFMLGAPVIRSQAPRAGGTFAAVMVDSSASMSIADPALSNRPRIDLAKEAIFGAGPQQAGLLKAIAGQCETVTYAFSDSIKRIDAPNQLDAQGQATNLFRAIHDVDAELRGVPLAAAVLVTDGCRNTGGSAEDAAKMLQARGVPLYVLALGDPNPPPDLEVVQVLAPARARRNSEVELDITVRHTGFKTPFDLLLKRGDTIILTRRIEPDGSGDLTRLRMAFTPDHEGSATYRVEIPAAKEEKLAQNNAKDFVLDLQDDRLPVLYIEGSPRQEYRFLRRALFRDPDFRLVGVLRLAPKRFYVQGANGNETYLKDGFPTTAEQLFTYQAIVLGDIEADVFSPQQLQLLEQFVKVRGGGLLMLGGVNSFGLGHYAPTPVGRMLPVSISPGDPPYSDEQYAASVVEKAMAHPVMKLALDAGENKALWDHAPPLVGITPVTGLKPGATMLLERQKTGQPVLAVQDYGAGRVAAFTSGGSWFWRMSKPASTEFHEKFWKQLIRWLVVGAREQLMVSTDAEIYTRRDPVTVRATVVGKDMTPLNEAKVVAQITDPLGNMQEIPMDWILSEEGVYECHFLPETEGQHKLAVRVEGWEAKPVEKGFLVSQPVLEFSDAGMKKEVLMRMAEATHGGYYEPAQLMAMIDAVKARVTQAALESAVPHDQPLWDMPMLFILLLGLFSAEWIIRRRKGLA